jgi:L-ascorbate metabolism protein UlaG (beta-lactamase superfamily)
LRQEAIGLLIHGSKTVYFAGDTDLFPEMADLASEHVDVALLPVAGWGPRLGAGHLDSRRAAEALRLIRPQIAVPIHWGYLRPVVLGSREPRYLTEPGHRFAELAATIAPDVTVRVLGPGEVLDVP